MVGKRLRNRPLANDDPRVPFPWRRLGRSERTRKPNNYAREVSIFDGYVTARDIRATWGVFETGINNAKRILHFDIKRHVAALLSKDNVRVVNVLDLGCGKGVALNDLKRLFGDRVRTFGQVAAVTSNEKYDGVDRLLVGSLTLPEKPLKLVDKSKVVNVNLDKCRVFRPRPIMDLIYSTYGPAYHSFLRLTIFEEVIKWLRPGGIAVIHFGTPYNRLELKNELAVLMKQYGVKEWFIKKGGILYFEKPFVKIP